MTKRRKKKKEYKFLRLILIVLVTIYSLYLKEIDDDMVVDVAYTIDGVNYHLLTDNVIDLGVLSSYGTLGDLSTYTIALSSNNDYVFDYYIDEYTFVDEVSYDS